MFSARFCSFLIVFWTQRWVDALQQTVEMHKLAGHRAVKHQAAGWERLTRKCKRNVPLLVVLGSTLTGCLRLQAGCCGATGGVIRRVSTKSTTLGRTSRRKRVGATGSSKGRDAWLKSEQKTWSGC